MKKNNLIFFEYTSTGFNIWFGRKFDENTNVWSYSKMISFSNQYGIKSVDNTVGFSDNNAKDDREAKVYDSTISLGKLRFGYTNWKFNK